MFQPADEEDLAYFLSRCDAGVPVLVIGLGSNLLVRDGGLKPPRPRGRVVIQLGKPFAAITVDGETVAAGAGVPDVKLASGAAQAGIAGLAFLRGIPGAIGGALRMNGGAYGTETADVLIEARGVSRDGAIRTYSRDDMGFTYRHCGIAEDVVFTHARFAGRTGDPETIRKEMAEITAARAATQPVNTRTGGSTFKNPEGRKAWQLVHDAGCRGLTHGDAQVSELHTNFLINRGRATASRRPGRSRRARPRPRARDERRLARVGDRQGREARMTHNEGCTAWP